MARPAGQHEVGSSDPGWGQPAHGCSSCSSPVGPQRPGGSGGYWAVVVLFVIGLFAVGAFILYKFKR